MSTQAQPHRRMIFVNLPVSDLDKAKAFYAALGFGFDLRFTDDKAACVVLEPDSIYVMLLSKPFFAGFTKRDICDTSTHTESLLCISCESREAVDAMVVAALESGGSATGMPVQDHGFMYGSSFYDPDGHHWEVAWMSQVPPEAAVN